MFAHTSFARTKKFSTICGADSEFWRKKRIQELRNSFHARGEPPLAWHSLEDDHEATRGPASGGGFTSGENTSTP